MAPVSSLAPVSESDQAPGVGVGSGPGVGSRIRPRRRGDIDGSGVFTYTIPRTRPVRRFLKQLLITELIAVQVVVVDPHIRIPGARAP